ncbi:MAG TPA: acyl carrier protein [Gammaproteobacteria bacterium]|nr:acyl carrier protein [Gammaproteobacteria bacterium]
MSQEDLSARFHNLLVERFELDPADIRPEARLYEDLDLDSIDAIDLAIVVRELTGRRVTPQEFRHVRTVADVEREIRRLIDED